MARRRSRSAMMADTALVAPFGSVACTHTHDSGIVCCIPCLQCRLPKQPPYARGLSRAEAIVTTLMLKSAVMRLRAHLSGHPCGMHAVFGASTLRRVQSSRIARCRDATRSSCVCHRCRSACSRQGSPLPGPPSMRPSHAGCPALICASQIRHRRAPFVSKPHGIS